MKSVCYFRLRPPFRWVFFKIFQVASEKIVIIIFHFCYILLEIFYLIDSAIEKAKIYSFR